MDSAAEARVQRAVGETVVGAERIVGRGYSNNRRWVARLADGRSVFVKHADDPATAGWLRREYAMYQRLDAALRPALLGWHDDGDLPVLVLEDLSGWDWPPPWTPDRMAAVRATLSRLAAHPVPDGLPPARETNCAEGGWPEVARDPEPFLALRLCSRRWLDRALPVLLAAASWEHLDGTALLHLDVRSDNLCFRGGRALLVDWNLAGVGNPDVDVAFWLPSLRMEGGPEPEAVFAPHPGIVALVAGFFASRAGLPVIPAAPRVRDVQQRQLRVALPWAARALGLPPPA